MLETHGKSLYLSINYLINQKLFSKDESFRKKKYVQINNSMY